jgi:hypothetical protein
MPEPTLLSTANVGTTEGLIPALGAGGKLASSLLPSIALTETLSAADISDSTAAGRTLLTAANAATQMAALGAETPAGAAAQINAATTATALAADFNAGTEVSAAADTDRLAVTAPAGGWLALAALWAWIVNKIGAITSITASGAWAFSSNTRPTSGGTDTPAATSLMTRDDVATHAYFSRRLFGNCSGTTGGGGSGATSRRGAANGVFDGDLQTTTTSGAFYKINIVSGTGISSLMGNAASGSVNLSAKWSMFFRIILQMGTNSHFYLCIGADGASGVPSSGTSVGMEITSATVARLFRCNAGAAVYSSNATISGITTSASTTDLFFWVDNDGAGNLSLFFAPKLFSASMPAKPATAIATLSGVASGFTGTDIAMYLRATAANPSVLTYIVMRDVVFTEY